MWTALFVVLMIGRAAFRVPTRRRLRRSTAPTEVDRSTATQLLQQHGGGTLSWMATWPENT